MSGLGQRLGLDLGVRVKTAGTRIAFRVPDPRRRFHAKKSVFRSSLKTHLFNWGYGVLLQPQLGAVFQFSYLLTYFFW